MKKNVNYFTLFVFSILFSFGVAMAQDSRMVANYESRSDIDDDDKKKTLDVYDSEGEVTSTITVEKKVYDSDELIANIKKQMNVSECHVQGDCLICYEPSYVCIPIRSECNCGE